jgi:amidase
MDFDRLDAVAIADMVRCGVAPVDFAVSAALDRMNAVNPIINAVITTFGDHVTDQLGTIRRDGLLAGVPFLIKDSAEYPGFRHTDGSRYFAQRIGHQIPAWMRAMMNEGAVIIGKTNTPEFGLMDTTEPLLHGPTRNPWRTTLSPGGSSGGAAAAVAAGIVPLAHGTDGGGSIRYPASCCGLFGFKPSHDLAVSPYLPVDPRLPGGAVRHVLTRSVRDSALVLAIAEAELNGTPETAKQNWVRSALSHPLRIAVIESPVHRGSLAPAHRTALYETAALLRELGHEIVETTWPFDGPRVHAAFFDLWAFGTYRYTQLLPEKERGPFLEAVEPFTRGLINRGRDIDRDRLENLVTVTQALKASMDVFHQTFDILLTPVSAVHPLVCGEHDPRLPFDTVMERVSHNVAFTFIQNATGQPAMSVPLHWTSDGLPIGAHFAADEGKDAMLLQLAYQLETARPWFNRRPPEPLTMTKETK